MHQRGKHQLQKLVQKPRKTARIANIDALPDETLQKIYSRPERDEQGLSRWLRAQATGMR
jgi:hypothetical protein